MFMARVFCFLCSLFTFNVTEHLTAQWTAQQIVEAFPFDTAPRYLLRDGDGIYRDQVRRTIDSLASVRPKTVFFPAGRQ